MRQQKGEPIYKQENVQTGGPTHAGALSEERVQPELRTRGSKSTWNTWSAKRTVACGDVSGEQILGEVQWEVLILVPIYFFIPLQNDLKT